MTDDSVSISIINENGKNEPLVPERFVTDLNNALGEKALEATTLRTLCAEQAAALEAQTKRMDELCKDAESYRHRLIEQAAALKAQAARIAELERRASGAEAMSSAKTRLIDAIRGDLSDAKTIIKQLARWMSA